MNREEQKEIEKENLYRHTKQFISSLKMERRQLIIRLQQIEKLEREMLLILSNPELAKEIIEGADKE